VRRGSQLDPVVDTGDKGIDGPESGQDQDRIGSLGPDLHVQEISSNNQYAEATNKLAAQVLFEEQSSAGLNPKLLSPTACPASIGDGREVTQLRTANHTERMRRTPSLRAWTPGHSFNAMANNRADIKQKVRL